MVKSNKPHVSTTRDMFGKKTGFLAILGEFSEKGKTKEDALANLQQAIDWYNQEFTPVSLHVEEHNRTYVLTRDFSGFSVSVIAEDPNPHYNMAPREITHMGRATITEALRHLQHYSA